jgi:hypothetical protein
MNGTIPQHSISRFWKKQSHTNTRVKDLFVYIFLFIFLHSFFILTSLSVALENDTLVSDNNVGTDVNESSKK